MCTRGGLPDPRQMAYAGGLLGYRANLLRQVGFFDTEANIATVAPLDAAFGAEVRVVNIGASIDDALMRMLTGALYEHRVIVIRDRELDEDGYLRFGRQWGTPISGSASV